MADGKFTLLLRLAGEKVEAAGERMRRAQALAVQAQGKMSQLDAFLSEYQQRLRDGGMRGMSISQWQDFQRFLARLQEAVQVQRGETDHAVQRFLLERQAWQDERKRLKAFEKLDEREAARLALAEARRSQKATDEFATRRFWDSQQVRDED
ncbi:flagellar export protein FliJ [Paludibacterium yongneupense]|uniref:flagellar export protein FliJ n=1 Tax=Paludibacterium yongneupense TaxID=400061 RepID=UPI000428662B|nr:flagellar export protein FliJ [Paludibacterium yongneupense]